MSMIKSSFVMSDPERFRTIQEASAFVPMARPSCLQTTTGDKASRMVMHETGKPQEDHRDASLGVDGADSKTIDGDSATIDTRTQHPRYI